MAETIKGINVVIGAETTGLSKALADVNKQSRDIQSELRQVDRLLKFNPRNTELLAQKKKLLGDQIAATREKLDRLRKVQEQVNEQFKKGEITEGQYRAFRRELVETESKLKHFEKQLKETSDRSKAFAEQMGKISGKLENLGKKFAPLSAVGAAVSGTLTTLAVKAGKLSDDLHTLADTTGLSMETLQKFQYASDLIDVSLETLTGSMSRMIRTMNTARQGNKQAQEAFDRLGIAITDANGQLRDGETVFNETIRALGNIANETERDAIAMQIFGRSARDLNPLIKGGADRLRELGEEAKAAGLIMSDESLGDILEFNDELDKLKATTKATGTQIGITIGKTMLPALQKLSEMLQGVLAWMRSLDERTLKMILIVSGVVAAITPLLLILAKVATALKVLAPLFAALTSPIGLVITAVAALVTAGILLARNWDKVKEAVLNVWDTIVYGIQQAISYIKTMVMSFAKTVLDGIYVIAKYIPGLSDSIESARNTLQHMIETERESIQYRREAREETKAQARALKEAEKEAERLKNMTAELKQETQELAISTAELTEAEKQLQEERAKFEEEWTKKLFQQTATRLELLEAEKKEALAKAKELQADTTAIEEYYRREREKIHEEENKKKAEFAEQWRQKLLQQQQSMAKTDEEQAAIRLELLRMERDQAIKAAEDQGHDTTQIRKYYETEELRIIEEYAQKKKDAREAFEKEWNKKYFEASADRMAILEAEMKEALAKAKELGASEVAIKDYYEQKKRELHRQTMLDQLATTQDIMGRIGNIFSQAFSNREQEIENWYQNQKNALEASLLDEEEKEAALKALDEERDKRKREAARKQAVMEKASSLFSIAINTARAIVEALPNLVLAGIIGSLGAAQAALVAAKPLPALAEGGKVVAPTMALIGEGRHDEAVLPLNSQVFAEIGKGIAAHLPQGDDRKVEFHFHIGALIGDERGYKKLAQKVFSYEYSHKQRILGEVPT